MSTSGSDFSMYLVAPEEFSLVDFKKFTTLNNGHQAVVEKTISQVNLTKNTTITAIIEKNSNSAWSSEIKNKYLEALEILKTRTDKLSSLYSSVATLMSTVKVYHADCDDCLFIYVKYKIAQNELNARRATLDGINDRIIMSHSNTNITQTTRAAMEGERSASEAAVASQEIEVAIAKKAYNEKYFYCENKRQKILGEVQLYTEEANSLITG